VQKPTVSPIPSSISTQAAPSAPPAANWANLVKAGPSIGFSPQPEVPVSQPQSFVAITQQQQQQAQQQKQAENYGSVDRRQNRDQNRERRISSNNSTNNNIGSNNNNNNNDGSCQLFLGNLPTQATEEELKGLFQEFGKIVDLRIHTKPSQKGNSNRPVPNYGFITFEDPQSAIKLQEFGVSRFNILLKKLILLILKLILCSQFSIQSCATELAKS
jgi:hypothetical protein